MSISMKLVYQYIAIFFTFLPSLNHLHPLQVENCDSNSRLVVDEDDNVNSGLKGLTKTFMMISNCKNPLISMVYTQLFYRCKG